MITLIRSNENKNNINAKTNTKNKQHSQNNTPQQQHNNNSHNNSNRNNNNYMKNTHSKNKHKDSYFGVKSGDLLIRLDIDNLTVLCNSVAKYCEIPNQYRDVARHWDMTQKLGTNLSQRQMEFPKSQTGNVSKCYRDHKLCGSCLEPQTATVVICRPS